MPITRKKSGDRQQLLHVTPEINQGKLNHYHSSDCMTLVPLSAAITLFYSTSDMQCGLLLGLYKNYCLGSYWWKLSHFADVVTVKFRRCSHFQFVCHYLPACAVMWETGVLFLCVCVCVCTSCNDWSWSHQQHSCKYLISTVATWVQYAPHKVICSYIWTLAHSSSNTSNPKNKKILILLHNIVLCSVLCTRCVVYSVYCILCFQLIARTRVCCYKQYLLSQSQKSEWKVTLQITRFLLMLTW